MKIKLYLIIVLVLMILINIGCSNSDNNPAYPVSSTPSAPDSLSATTISATSVALNWIDNSDNEDEFVIDYSLNYNFNTFTGISIPADSTSTIISNLSPETQYLFRVYALNSEGNSQYSNIDSATTYSVLINIDVSSPVANDSLYADISFTVEVQLTGYTSNYAQLNFYLGDSHIPLYESWNLAMLQTLAETQPTDAIIFQEISTVGLMEGNYDLIVEAVGTNFTIDEVIIPIYLKPPDDDAPWIDFEILSPDTTEYAIGDIVKFEIGLLGNMTMFLSFDAYLLEVSPDPFFAAHTFDDTLNFEYDTADLSVGNHEMKFQLTVIDDEVKEKTFHFTLIEPVP